MHASTTLQHSVMIAVSFICGVLCFQFFSVDQATAIISIVDSRILTELPYSISSSIIPVAISIIFVLIFSTHSYLASLTLIFIALRATFFGFTSVYILTQINDMKLYAYWWFPFQLLYCIVLIWLYRIICIQISIKRRTFVAKLLRVVLCIIIIAAILCAEIVIIKAVIM